MSASIPEISGASLIERLRSSSPKVNYPVLCQWEITCRCNFKCVMCYTDCFNTPESLKKELNTPEIFRIMDEMKDAGLLELVLTGGEPMSHPDFESIYIKSVQNGFLTTVFTNGWFIDEHYLDLWSNFPPARIEISYHGFRPETFEQITGVKNSQIRIRQAIDQIYKNNIPLTIKLTGLTLNHQEILDIKAFIRSMPGVNFRFGEIIRPAANGDTSAQRYQLSDDVLDQITAADEELTIAFKKQARDPEFNAPCHSGINRFHIDAFGNLNLCSSNRRNAYSLRTGNFKDGFYHHLPQFFCPNKITHMASNLPHCGVSHACS